MNEDRQFIECRFFIAGVEVYRCVDEPRPTFRRQIAKRPPLIPRLFDPNAPVSFDSHIDTFLLMGFEVGKDGKPWARYEKEIARSRIAQPLAPGRVSYCACCGEEFSVEPHASKPPPIECTTCIGLWRRFRNL
jgi:hypothetical protein